MRSFEEFREEAILQGWVPEEITDEKEHHWLDKMLRMKYCKTLNWPPRVINHFKIGADPEFVFGLDGTESRLYPANQIGLKTGLAFGADMNGRLVELRPYPSRSALEVTASVLSTLRWGARFYWDVTHQLSWQAGAFLYGDGLGGHVHFGRKRPNRDVEVRALGNIYKCLVNQRVFPSNQVLTRLKGDSRHQIYGKEDDIRLQLHGYEYRGFPSWLDSPYATFISLTLAKLAVLKAEVVSRWTVGMAQSPTSTLNRQLFNLLAYYKGRDDDARLAYFLIKNKGWPQYYGGDFKDRWGLRYIEPDQSLPTLIPMDIKPTLEEIKEIHGHLLFGEILQPRREEPTWQPPHVPQGFYLPLSSIETTGKKGIGEMLWDVCCDKRFPITIAARETDSYSCLGISKTLKSQLPACAEEFRKQVISYAYIQVYTEEGSQYRIDIPSTWRNDNTKAHLLKKLLLCGIFPLWRVGDCKPDSLDRWLELPRNKEKAPKKASVQLY